MRDVVALMAPMLILLLFACIGMLFALNQHKHDCEARGGHLEGIHGGTLCLGADGRVLDF